MPTFYEFFAGGGMVSAALRPEWECLFANDFDQKKAQAYRANWGEENFLHCDIRAIDAAMVPGKADLAWASFPCQDLSLAGGGAGLKGDRSGTFWPFIKLIRELRKQGRHPKIVALENVIGTITSHKGKDFETIVAELNEIGYYVGAIVVDAALFVPQSRPRLFIIATQERPNELVPRPAMLGYWCTPALLQAYDNLPARSKERWVWWRLPSPRPRQIDFIDIIEDRPESVHWHTQAETDALVSLMSDVNRRKLHDAKIRNRKIVGGLYRRTRYSNGKKIQRAEVRFDKISGCLRTPTGGSSRQFIILVEGGNVSSRLISSRETARLMGLPDSYKLPNKYNEAYHLTGDGVAVPVVSFIADHVFRALLGGRDSEKRIAAE